MIIRKAEFITSMRDYGNFPGKGMPEVVFAGRSNVGKSSMINKLTNRRKLARTSSDPGRTRLINIFRVNDEVNLVDLPGYGFAKVSKQEKISWGRMMQDYFAKTEDLCHVFHLVDIRHDPSQEDCEMNAFLRGNGIPFTVVATKADKISRGARMKYIAPICRALFVQPWQVIPFSSEDGTGRDAVLDILERTCYVLEEIEENEDSTDSSQKND
ncbi:MAG: YihA family ribosome biogenesis GTP-binding protein [Clostridia bacterium]|nr:YihA family ribosome biogenesis GTP-binding protein [Clostridia bacterium]